MFSKIPLTENLTLPTYFLIISLTFTFLLFWLSHRCKLLKKDLKKALKIALGLMLGGFFGARLLYIFYTPSYFLKNPLEIFFVWEGGFVFHGGLLGGGLLALFILRKNQWPFGAWADFFAPLISLGYAVGRLACFFNGCCYGKFCSLPWAYEDRHPTQLYASFWEFFVFLFILSQEKKTLIKEESLSSEGRLFFLWLGLHALGRLVMEVFRDDFRGPVYFFPSSVWISFVLLFVCLIYFLKKFLNFKSQSMYKKKL